MQNREILKIKEKISLLNLNLEGFEILTEVGSGLYNYMPLIPLLAGAQRVMAWTRDSRFGTASEVIKNCQEVAQVLPNFNKIEFYIGNLNEQHLRQADLITNSALLRPLDQSKLMYVKDSTVIPLMFEAWEARKEDVDIGYCNRRGIKVAGTNESHHELDVFTQVGHLALKMAFEAGYEIYGNKILIWSDDDFGQVIKEKFLMLDAADVIVTTDFEKLTQLIPTLDFVFISDYDEERSYNDSTFFNLDRLRKLNQNFGIIHLFGEIDSLTLRDKGFNIYPPDNGIGKNMSRTLSYLGIEPFFSLMVGGFKVGEHLLRGNMNEKMLQVLA